MPLAMLAADAPTAVGAAPITIAGTIVGTPRYMAPEQFLAAPSDARTDIFAAGVLLFEMIGGRAPFDDPSPLKLFHDIVYENPPNLTGSAAIAGVNQVLRRAMAKRPEDRYATAGAMAADLREVLLISDASQAVIARQMTRLIVLPFRTLRPDPDTDFLAVAIPEAITSSLAAVQSLVLRSSMAAARLAGETDLVRLASEADVDVALTGTMMRAGDQLRVSTQLVELPSGTILWSLTSQATMSDLFDLQDTLTQRIVQSLELPLTAREAEMVRGDVPATPLAHEFYLRAGQQGESPEGWARARDLYRRALDEDPRYAPAWAKLARTYLMIGKYCGDTAANYAASQSAVKRALELNPKLAAAHDASTKLEVATGKAQEAMLRLLSMLDDRVNDPALFSALVMTCRFCGLLEASAAAHEHALALDPHAKTSAEHTYWMLGRYEEALAAVDVERDFGGDEAFIHLSMGNYEKGLAVFDARLASMRASGVSADSFVAQITRGFRAAAERNVEPAVEILSRFADFPDGEGVFYMARCYAYLGEKDRALETLERAEELGFFCFPFFASDSWLDPLRAESRFRALMQKVEARSREAAQAFDAHRGSRLLRVGHRT
jgi:eukaryotic-like serine/threonine-protein kinase